MICIKYPAHSIFEHGTFAVYNSLEEAERQAANDLLNIEIDINGKVRATQRRGPAPFDGIVEVPDKGWSVPDYASGVDPREVEKTYELIHGKSDIRKLAKKHQTDIVQEMIDGMVEYYVGIKKAIEDGTDLKNVVPGNAYKVTSGGTTTGGAIPLAAATIKTVAAITAGAANQPSLVEAKISFDGISATGVPVLCEWISGTATTAGTSTAGTAKQVRGWPLQTSQNSVAYNYTAEPTTLESFDKLFLTPNGGVLVMQYPLGREPTGLVTAATQFKVMGLRLTAPAAVNCHVSLEYEE